MGYKVRVGAVTAFQAEGTGKDPSLFYTPGKDAPLTIRKTAPRSSGSSQVYFCNSQGVPSVKYQNRQEESQAHPRRLSVEGAQNPRHGRGVVEDRRLTGVLGLGPALPSANNAPRGTPAHPRPQPCLVLTTPHRGHRLALALARC